MGAALCWTPRILGVLVVLFHALFLLHAIKDPGGHGRVVAVLMHSVPTALVAGALAVAWRWPLPGGILFLLLGVGYLVKFWGRFPWVTYAIVAGPLFLVGALFLAGHLGAAGPRA